MADLKHVGRVIASGKKCIVAYRTLPGDAYNCLIVPTENLPDSYHDALINLVESNAGQSAYEFAEAMARANFPDGSVMLPALHTQNRLVKISTDQIEMIPSSLQSVRLSELNQIIAEQRGTTIDELSLKSAIKEEPFQNKKSVKEETAESKAALVELLTPEQQAKHYRSEADRLSKEAAALRRQAEDLVPTAKKAKTETVAEEVVTTAKKANVVKTDETTS